MCTIAVKYFEGTGFVGVKNRDRNYLPSITFKQSFRRGVERCYLYDNITGYTEGLNEHGICIMSAATIVLDDEKEYDRAKLMKKKLYKSNDGKKIRTALLEKTVKTAVQSLIDNELSGHTFIFDTDACYILEGAREHIDDIENTDIAKDISKVKLRMKGQYFHKIKKVSKEETIVRTNHGIVFPWEGYQADGNSFMKKARISSEARLKTTEKNLKDVIHSADMLSAISSLADKNPQLNPLRLKNYKDVKFLKTTGQIMMNPSTLTLTYRNIWSELKADYNKINSQKSKTFLNITSIDLPISEKIESFSVFCKNK